jgi:hypothetical protein
MKKKLSPLVVLLSFLMLTFVFSSCRSRVVLSTNDSGNNGRKVGWYKNGKAYGAHPSQNRNNGKGKGNSNQQHKRRGGVSVEVR